MSSLRDLPKWEAPTSQEVGETAEDFLARLGQPTVVWLPGRDVGRTRAISTLLHGNEPSGLRALHRWIREGRQPQVNLLCIVGNVDAALIDPVFSHRYRPDGYDLNRCFRSPYTSWEGLLAKAILDILHQAQPETLLDIHNTSGRSPAYGVTTVHGDMQQTLTQFFSDHLIVTDLRLGSLMEATEKAWPTVTIEAGGMRDSQSDKIAFDGFAAYALADDLFTYTSHVTVAKHPIRVELRKGMTLAYAHEPVSHVDLTLIPDIDCYNFGVLSPETTLGWVQAYEGDVVMAKDAMGHDLSAATFHIAGRELRVKNPSRLMMATTSPEIARNDCLFYILPLASQ